MAAYEHIDRYVRNVVDILGCQTSDDGSLGATDREWDVLINHRGICRYLRVRMYRATCAPYALVPNPSLDASAWQTAISKIDAAILVYEMIPGATAATTAGVVKSINDAILVLCGIEAKTNSYIVYASDTATGDQGSQKMPTHAYIAQYVANVMCMLGRQTSSDDSLRDTKREWVDLLGKMDIKLRLNIRMFWLGGAPFALNPRGGAPFALNPSINASAWQAAMSEIDAAIREYERKPTVDAIRVVDSIIDAINVLYGVAWGLPSVTRSTDAAPW